MISPAKVGRRYSITIPRDVRKRAGLKVGQRVLVRLVGKEITIIPLPDDPGKVLAEIIDFSYDEERDEPLAERWLRKNAGR